MNAYKKLFSRLESKAQPITDQDASSRHILLVDDDSLFCKTISDVLTEAGYAVSVAANGKSALSLLATHPKAYDLILLDRMMPELSGLEVLSQLSLGSSSHDIPVIMLTGHAGKAHIDMASQYGVSETIFKPIRNMDLLEVVQRALKNKEKEKSLMYN